MTQPNLTKLLDFTALMDIQKKNIEALTEANKLAFEGFQAAGQCQAEIFSNIVKDASSIITEITDEGTAEERTVRHADLIQKSYKRSFSHWRELADIIGESSKEASDIVNRRITASFAEFQSVLGKNEKERTRKKAA
jgi:phasin family protein